MVVDMIDSCDWEVYLFILLPLISMIVWERLGQFFLKKFWRRGFL